MARQVPDSRIGRRVEGGKVIIHESAPGGMRKIRTPNHQLAVETRDRNGATILKSPDGRTYKSKPMK